jgi:prophage DNA circulation protein
MSFDSTCVEETILNLKMISKIKQNDKLIIVNKILHVDNRILQPVFRWYSADNRYDTINFITDVINEGIEFSRTLEHPIFNVDTIKEELLNATNGLDNLSATYKLDNLVIAKIDILKEKINKSCT